MAETNEKRRKQSKSKRTKKGTQCTSGRSSKSQAACGSQDARDTLHGAIDEEVKANSEKIARAIVRKSIEGDASLTRLLVDCSGAKKRQKAPTEESGGPSLARRWAAERQWDGQLDCDSETGFGGREPEV